MEKKVMVICSVVGFLGILSAALGFAAEAKRIKSSQIQFPTPSTCIYPGTPALGLGFSAALALMIAQIIVNVTTGCLCCKRGPHQSNSKWTLALVCFVVSWLTFVVAFLLLLTGAALNDQHGERSMYFGYYYCYVIKPGVFAIAAVLSLASVTFGIAYYLALSSMKSTDPSWGGALPSQPGIAMGQPRAPSLESQSPVFVHEDTYMRRQFT